MSTSFPALNLNEFGSSVASATDYSAPSSIDIDSEAPELASISPTTTPSTSTPATGASSWFSTGIAALEQGVGLNPVGEQATAAGVPGGGSTITNIVFIVLGIVLIGIGALSFKATQTVIQTAGNAVTRTAEVT